MIIVNIIKGNEKVGGTSMEETISLQEIFQVIKKRFLLIVSFVVGAALLAAIVSYFVLTPKYEATSQFIVNQGTDDPNAQVSVNDIRTNVELINTYEVIIKSRAILEEVVNELNLDYSASALERNIEVTSAALFKNSFCDKEIKKSLVLLSIKKASNN